MNAGELSSHYTTGAGEVGIETTPILAESFPEARFAAQLDALLRRTGQDRACADPPEQAALKL